MPQYNDSRRFVSKTAKIIVMYSGGATSWAAAKRTVEVYGKERTTLLFGDTLIEDEDTYRFIDESVLDLGCEFVRIADGRDPWEVFIDEKFIGNSRVDPCSRVLKRELMMKYIKNINNNDVIIVFGLDWQERHRIDGTGKPNTGVRNIMLAKGFSTWFPMDETPYMTKNEILSWMKKCGIKPPRLYDMGFGHNNCGGFCVKAGTGQMKHLLKTMPDRYRYHEQREQDAIEKIGPSAKPFIKITRNKTQYYLTLKQFREFCESHPSYADDHGYGCGGGCAVDDGLTQISEE